MITERTPGFSFGTPRRRPPGMGQFDFTFDPSVAIPSDWSFAGDLAAGMQDYFSGLPDISMDLNAAPAPSNYAINPVSNVSSSPNIDTPSIDWGSALATLTKTVGALAPTALAIYKTATAEGQPAQGKTAPPGYYYTATGQLAPISGAGGGMSWVMIAALAAGAYFLAKR